MQKLKEEETEQKSDLEPEEQSEEKSNTETEQEPEAPEE